MNARRSFAISLPSRRTPRMSTRDSSISVCSKAVTAPSRDPARWKSMNSFTKISSPWSANCAHSAVASKPPSAITSSSITQGSSQALSASRKLKCGMKLCSPQQNYHRTVPSITNPLWKTIWLRPQKWVRPLIWSPTTSTAWPLASHNSVLKFVKQTSMTKNLSQLTNCRGHINGLCQ